VPTVDEFRAARGTASWLDPTTDKKESNMHYDLTITAVANRDESCNLLTMTETHRFSIAMPPSADKIKELCEAHKQKFLDSWPHNRQAKPVLVPLDVTVTLNDGE
jgi:hypothetical protein